MAMAAKESGADLIGLVFAAGSRRRISLAAAQEIASKVSGIGKVGVFVNAPLNEVRTIARDLRLDFVQLHGDEPPEYCREVGVPVIKAVRADLALSAAAPDLDSHPAAWILLDSFAKSQFGGTGIPFDWAALRPVREQLSKPLLIAGGLTGENVRAAVRILRPEGVDVSSGVETGGEKDRGKMADFVRAVRMAESEEIFDAGCFSAGKNC